MNRPTVEVADIFRATGDNFIDQHTLGIQQLKVIRAIMRCRTAALGGHADVCPNCQEAPVIWQIHRALGEVSVVGRGIMPSVQRSEIHVVVD